MKVIRFLAVFLLFAVSISADSLRLNTRKQVKAGDNFVSKTEVTKWDAKKTAVVICDMWSKHWCASATGRVGEMAPRMNAVVESARKKGCLIIHCPSGWVKLYADTPMRDLTDTMYNPRMRPFVSHFRGTDLIVKHIEKFWCPTITSVDFVGGEPLKFKNDK